LQVLTNRYDDCTCGTASIAVWFRPGEVEVPISYLPEAPLTREELDDLGGPASPVDLVIDEELRIWIKGRAATEAQFKAVLLRWQKDPAESKRRNEAGRLWIYLDPPPVLPLKQEAILKQLISRIRAFTEQNEIELFVSGFRVAGQ
jgi:hypothetical protein